MYGDTVITVSLRTGASTSKLPGTESWSFVSVHFTGPGVHSWQQLKQEAALPDVPVGAIAPAPIEKKAWRVESQRDITAALQRSDGAAIEIKKLRDELTLLKAIKRDAIPIQGDKR